MKYTLCYDCANGMPWYKEIDKEIGEKEILKICLENAFRNSINVSVLKEHGNGYDVVYNHDFTDDEKALIQYRVSKDEELREFLK